MALPVAKEDVTRVDYIKTRSVDQGRQRVDSRYNTPELFQPGVEDRR